MSNVDSLRVTIYGVGGHGARPEATIAPSSSPLAPSSRCRRLCRAEVSPFDSAVVTIGTLHAGTKNNIIPDQATMALSVRSLTPTPRASTF